MNNQQNNGTNRTYYQLAVGWLKQGKNGQEYVSASTANKNSNPKFKSKTAKLFAEMENGEMVPVESFAMYFNDKEEGSNAPDVRFVMSTN